MIARTALLPLLLPVLLAARDDPLAGRTPGPAQECLDLDRVQGPDTVGPRTILYRENRRRIWRVEPIGTCATMRSGDTLVVQVFGRQMCRNDRFSVVRYGTPLGGTCRFDRFVPYDRAR